MIMAKHGSQPCLPENPGTKPAGEPQCRNGWLVPCLAMIAHKEQVLPHGTVSSTQVGKGSWQALVSLSGHSSEVPALDICIHLSQNHFSPGATVMASGRSYSWAGRVRVSRGGVSPHDPQGQLTGSRTCSTRTLARYDSHPIYHHLGNSLL